MLMRWQFVLILTIIFCCCAPYAYAQSFNTDTNTTYFSVHLRNASGSKDVNASFTNAQFFVRPQHNETMRISRMLVSIKDAAIDNYDDYGAINGGLPNGIQVWLDKNGTLFRLDDNHPIKTNGDWAALCYDVAISNLGAGDDYVTIRWSFYKSAGGSTDGGIELVGKNNDRFYIVANDDLTGLTQHHFIVQGQYDEDQPEALSMIAVAIFLVAAYTFLFYLIKELRTETAFWEWAKNILMVFCFFMSIAGVYTAYVMVNGTATDVASTILISYVPYIFVGMFLFCLIVILFVGDVMTKMLAYVMSRKFLKKRGGR